MLSLLNLTANAYAAAVKERLGRGERHARLIYREWYRTGRVKAEDPAFGTAQTLLQAILQISDFSLPDVTAIPFNGQTSKFLIRTHDKLEIESVVIPMQAGGTLCVSSQVGCRMGCSFCETGRMGLLRNLTAGEIVAQVFLARHHLGADVRNIVFMGMGEPFDNYDQVMHAFRILSDPDGLGFGHRHIAISTSGLVDGIDRLIAEGEVAPNLAVSINGSNDLIRQKLMPINRRFSMEALYQAIKRYNEATGREVLTAYVLLQGINDSLAHAEELASFLQGLQVKVNLIPFNPLSRDRYQPPEPRIIEAFFSHLHQRGLRPLIRHTKGRDIMAACGQLGNLELRRTKLRIAPLES